MSKKLIIVCDEKRRKYGDFLAQLISLEDDRDDQVIGVKDGSVAAQVWLEKDYEVNSHLISSDQYILFLGNSKLVKDKRLHMKSMFSEYGMEYGWLGRQAALCITKSLDVDEYGSFVEYAKDYSSDINRLVEKKEDEAIAVLEEPEGAEHNDVKQKLRGSLKGMSVAVANASAKGLNSFNMKANSKKVEDQQYSCAVLLFYLNGLSSFLGLE